MTAITDTNFDELVLKSVWTLPYDYPYRGGVGSRVRRQIPYRQMQRGRLLGDPYEIRYQKHPYTSFL